MKIHSLASFVIARLPARREAARPVHPETSPDADQPSPRLQPWPQLRASDFGLSDDELLILPADGASHGLQQPQAQCLCGE